MGLTKRRPQKAGGAPVAGVRTDPEALRISHTLLPPGASPHPEVSTQHSHLGPP